MVRGYTYAYIGGCGILALMKVVLLTDVKGVGVHGEVCEVGDGYALNFLIPKCLALEEKSERGAQLIAQHAAKKKEVTHQEQLDEGAFLALPKEITLTERVNEQGTLFRAVTPARIVAALKEQGFASDVLWFASVALKEVGEHPVSLCHGTATTTLSVRIVAQ